MELAEGEFADLVFSPTVLLCQQQASFKDPAKSVAVGVSFLVCTSCL
jgi:hypothetical protein